jgi:hypothetical protein
MSGTEIKAQFARADAARTHQEKGRILEDLISSLFSTVPGIEVAERNEFNIFDTEEIDIAFWNDKHTNGLPFLDYVFLVECKNWSSPVGSMDVAWFLTKLRNSGLPFGILIAASGITGDPRDKTDAHSIVFNARSEQRKIIVITRQELEIMDDASTLIRLIKVKLTKLAVAGRLFD